MSALIIAATITGLVAVLWLAAICVVLICDTLSDDSDDALEHDA